MNPKYMICLQSFSRKPREAWTVESSEVLDPITRVNVALNANVRSPTCAFLGSILFADARMGRTVDDPMKKRVKVAAKQTSKFRRLCELTVPLDNVARVENPVIE